MIQYNLWRPSIAEKSPLLCFDEFQVTDVTDAIILGRLFEALFARGVLLVLTSNRIPDDLYKDGLNRGLFLPTIELIKNKLEVVELNGPMDYRLERMKGMEVYHFPLGEKATKELSNAFWRLTDHEVDDRTEVGPDTIEVQGRVLTVPVASRGVAVVSFKKCVVRHSVLRIIWHLLGSITLSLWWVYLYLALRTEMRQNDS